MNLLLGLQFVFLKYINRSTMTSSLRFIILLITVPSITFFDSTMAFKMEELKDKDSILPDIFHSYFSNPNLAILSSIILIIIVSKDYKYNILEKNIADGLRRLDVFNIRIMLIGIFVFVYSLFNLFLFGVIAVFYKFSLIAIIHSFSLETILRQMFACLLLNCIGIFLIDILKSSTSAIICLVSYILIEAITRLVLEIKNLYLPFGITVQVLQRPSIEYQLVSAFIFYLLIFLLIDKRIVERLQF